MYIPESHAEHDLPTLLDFVERHPLAARRGGEERAASRLVLVRQCLVRRRS